MKKAALVFIFSVFALLTLLMTLSVAEDQKGVITVTPNIGAYFFEGNQELEDGITSGINIGYDFNKTCSVEGSFN
ncbi:hypothetical protein [Desulfobacterium sp. N47]|uniref:Outer membrane protein beta-barrel domain-containing protein n=1 Tax=uncultured Desulfobacterium sp. TaxID=201089 RepID=E1YIT8_9BACT|nr:unknown protein [uncultured Desulfobacterium sp.]